MSDIAVMSFVRKELVGERPAPVKTTGFIGFLRTRLFNSPTSILFTIVGAALIWFTVIPAVKFLLFDAVWTGSDRNACLEQNAGHPVGACWPYISAKFTQFIQGDEKFGKRRKGRIDWHEAIIHGVLRHIARKVDLTLLYVRAVILVGEKFITA